MDIGQIITNVSADLNDAAHVRWSVPELLEYLNSGLTQLVTVRPDANAHRRVVNLASGASQAIPADAMLLLDVVCNVPSGRSVRGPVEYETLKAAAPFWRASDRAVDVRDYAYDATRDKRRFEIFPPAIAGSMLEIEISVKPSTLTSTEAPWDVFPLDDEYAEAIESWMKHKALMRVGGEASLPRATGHLRMFYQLLGVQMTAEVAASGGAQ